MNGRFSAWGGWLIARGRPILLAGGSDAQHADAQRQLQRIGFDSVAGALDGGMDAWMSSGRELSTFETKDIEDMAEWILSAEPMTVVDTRDEHEWAAGHVPGALHLYVPDVSHRAGEIPTEAPVAVHCASGYRAGIAASLLEQAGATHNRALPRPRAGAGRPSLSGRVRARQISSDGQRFPQLAGTHW